MSKAIQIISNQRAEQTANNARLDINLASERANLEVTKSANKAAFYNDLVGIAKPFVNKVAEKIVSDVNAKAVESAQDFYENKLAAIINDSYIYYSNELKNPESGYTFNPEDGDKFCITAFKNDVNAKIDAAIEDLPNSVKKLIQDNRGSWVSKKVNEMYEYQLAWTQSDKQYSGEKDGNLTQEKVRSGDIGYLDTAIQKQKAIGEAGGRDMSVVGNNYANATDIGNYKAIEATTDIIDSDEAVAKIKEQYPDVYTNAYNSAKQKAGETPTSSQIYDEVELASRDEESKAYSYKFKDYNENLYYVTTGSVEYAQSMSSLRTPQGDADILIGNTVSQAKRDIQDMGLSYEDIRTKQYLDPNSINPVTGKPFSEENGIEAFMLYQANKDDAVEREIEKDKARAQETYKTEVAPILADVLSNGGIVDSATIENMLLDNNIRFEALEERDQQHLTQMGVRGDNIQMLAKAANEGGFSPSNPVNSLSPSVASSYVPVERNKDGLPEGFEYDYKGSIVQLPDYTRLIANEDSSYIDAMSKYNLTSGTAEFTTLIKAYENLEKARADVNDALIKQYQAEIHEYTKQATEFLQAKADGLASAFATDFFLPNVYFDRYGMVEDTFVNTILQTGMFASCDKDEDKGTYTFVTNDGQEFTDINRNDLGFMLSYASQGYAEKQATQAVAQKYSQRYTDWIKANEFEDNEENQSKFELEFGHERQLYFEDAYKAYLKDFVDNVSLYGKAQTLEEFKDSCEDLKEYGKLVGLKDSDLKKLDATEMVNGGIVGAYENLIKDMENGSQSIRTPNDVNYISDETGERLDPTSYALSYWLNSDLTWGQVYNWAEQEVAHFSAETISALKDTSLDKLIDNIPSVTASTKDTIKSVIKELADNNAYMIDDIYKGAIKVLSNSTNPEKDIADLKVELETYLKSQFASSLTTQGSKTVAEIGTGNKFNGDLKKDCINAGVELLNGKNPIAKYMNAENKISSLPQVFNNPKTPEYSLLNATADAIEKMSDDDVFRLCVKLGFQCTGGDISIDFDNEDFTTEWENFQNTHPTLAKEVLTYAGAIKYRFDDRKKLEKTIAKEGLSLVDYNWYTGEAKLSNGVRVGTNNNGHDMMIMNKNGSLSDVPLEWLTREYAISLDSKIASDFIRNVPSRTREQYFSGEIGEYGSSLLISTSQNATNYLNAMQKLIEDGAITGYWGFKTVYKEKEANNAGEYQTGTEYIKYLGVDTVYVDAGKKNPALAMFEQEFGQIYGQSKQNSRISNKRLIDKFMSTSTGGGNSW